MLTQFKMTDVRTQKKLDLDLVRYLTSLRISEFKPEPHKVVLAMVKYFSEQYVAEAKNDYLASIGISFIFHVSTPEEITVISCSVTDSESDAQEQFLKFSKQSYQEFRNDLEINSHWVFLVPNQDINLNSRDEFIDCFANFQDDGRPSCWITDVY